MLLALTPLGVGATVAPEVALVGVPWVSGPCADPRLPALAGEWLVGCGALRADRAQNLRTGERVTLRHAVEQVALGPGVVYGAPGLWVLDEGGVLQGQVLKMREGVLATDGETAVASTRDDLQVGALADNRREHLLPAPAPWYRPAVAGGHVAWVSRGEDIWYRGPGEQPRALADSAGAERHVALSSAHVAWVADDAVVLMALPDGPLMRLPADAHTARGLSLDGDVVCWEQWNGVDVDVACSDGVAIQRPGHQRNPSRFGPWLTVVEEGHALLLHLPSAEGDTLQP